MSFGCKLLKGAISNVKAADSLLARGFEGVPKNGFSWSWLRHPFRPWQPGLEHFLAHWLWRGCAVALRPAQGLSSAWLNCRPNSVGLNGLVVRTFAPERCHFRSLGMCKRWLVEEWETLSDKSNARVELIEELDCVIVGLLVGRI